jgi:hypothetical protein
LPCNYRRDTRTETQSDGSDGFKKYAVEMGSVAMIYIRNFKKIGSGIQKFIRGGIIDLVSLLLFFEIRKIGQKLLIMGMNQSIVTYKRTIPTFA